MKTSDKSSIFDGLSQLMDDVDPKRIVPLVDRVLVRDLGEQEKVGSLHIPQTAAERGAGKHGLVRLCEVVAVGPGDKWRESKPGPTGQVKRRVVRCRHCDGSGKDAFGGCIHSDRAGGPCDHPECTPRIFYVECDLCGGDGAGRLPMEVKVGDRVLCDRRKDLEIFVNGVRYSLVNCEQSILAVVE